METIRTETMNGIETIVGFDKLQKDPVETRRAVCALMVETDEHKTLTEVEARLQAEYARLRTLHGNGVKLVSAELDTLWAEHDIARAQFVAKLDQCYRENAVYFEPRRGERIVDNVAELKQKFKSLGPHERLDTNGDTIVDFRGIEYYTDGSDGWTKHTHEQLGEPLPDGAITADKLTEAQRTQINKDVDMKRIRELSASERHTEKQVRLQSAAAQAAQHRSIQEIKGANAVDALADAQSLHTMLVDEIEQLYS
jgi:hypothetical protein